MCVCVCVCVFVVFHFKPGYCKIRIRCLDFLYL